MFVQKSWVERQSEHPTRRRLVKVETISENEAVYDVSRDEGNVTTAGDPFNKANMDDLEGRIYEAFSEVNAQINAMPEILYGTSAPTAAQGKNGDLYVLITT